MEGIFNDRYRDFSPEPNATLSRVFAFAVSDSFRDLRSRFSRGKHAGEKDIRAKRDFSPRLTDAVAISLAIAGRACVGSVRVRACTSVRKRGP